MNPSEQRAHTTRVDQLERDVERLLEKIAADTRDRFTAERQTSANAWNSERTHRLEMAEQQRAYVDQEDRKLREGVKRLTERVADLELDHTRRNVQGRTIWGRIGWLLRGRSWDR